MRTFIIGDVHGMLPELELLVGRLRARPGDRFGFLGDLVDKGPDSLGVVDFVRRLVRCYPGSWVISGNHEESALRLYDKAQKAGSWDGLKKADKEPWLRSLDAERADWLRSLPLFVRVSDSILAVHGGLFPAYFDHYHSLPSASPEDWHKGGGKTVDRMRRFLRIRHVYKPGALSSQGKDVSGQMVELGNEGPSTQRWADWYDGREGFVFFGHDPSRSGEPIKYRHAIGMDTGAVFGGRLTGAILEDGADPSAVRFVSVPGRPFANWILNQGE
ncbi:MAG: metallophosphoesterase family protein [Nitrospira sp.]